MKANSTFRIFTVLVLSLLIVLILGSSLNAQASRSQISTNLSLYAVSHLDGVINTVTVHKGRLVAGIGPRIEILDFASTNRSISIGNTVALPEDVVAVVAHDDIAYAGTGNGGLYAIDLTNHRNPTVIWHANEAAFALTVQGDTLVVASGWQGLMLYDITEPRQPTLDGLVESLGDFVRALAIHENHVYIAGTEDAYVVNISDRHDPIVTNEFITGFRVGGLEVVDDNLYATVTDLETGYRALLAYSLANPTWPNQIGAYDDVAGSLFIDWPYAYLDTAILDISNPSQIQYAGLLDFVGATAMARTAKGLAFAVRNHIYLVNGSDVQHVVKLPLFQSASYLKLFRAEGNILLAVASSLSDTPSWTSQGAGTHSRIAAFDLDNPYTPYSLGSQQLPASISDVFSVDNIVYVATSDGLHLLQLSQSGQLTELGFAPAKWPSAIYVQDQYAYINSGAEGKLIIFDVSDPSAPRRVSAMNLPLVSSIFSNKDYLYITSQAVDISGNLLTVLSIASPANPVAMGSIQLGNHYCFANIESILYCAAQPGLVIYDVGNPQEPREIQKILPSSYLQGVWSTEEQLYAKEYLGDLIVLDVSQNPLDPTELARTKVTYSANDVEILDNTVYMASTESGLRALTWATDEAVTVTGEETDLQFTNGTYNYSFSKETFPDVDVMNPLNFVHTALTATALSEGPPGLPTQLALNNRAWRYGDLSEPDTGPYDLVINYQDSDLKLATEETLMLYRNDDGKWIPEPSTRIDTVENKLTARPESFGLFAVSGRATAEHFFPTVGALFGDAQPEITSVEVTQGTQQLTNNVPLVSARPTMVRVHVKVASAIPSDGNSIELEGYRQGQPLPGSPLRQENWAVFPRPQRAFLSNSVNFYLPVSWLEGNVKLIAKLVDHGVAAQRSVEVSFSEVSPLQVVLVPVESKDLGSNMTCPAPSIDPTTYQIQLEQLFPVPKALISVRSQAHLEGYDMQDMLMAVLGLKAADGISSHVIYYGAIGRVSASGDDYCIDGANGLGMFGRRVSVGDPVPWVMAHETGHNLSLLHADYGEPGNLDPNYPYPEGSIGVYGFDPFTSHVWTPGWPDHAKDFMSYVPNGWISDYHYRKLFENQRQHGLPTAYSEAEKVMLVRISRRDQEDKFEFAPVYVLEAFPTRLPEKSALELELVDGVGHTIKRFPLETVIAEEDGQLIEAAVANLPIRERDDVRRLRLWENGALVAESKIEKTISSTETANARLDRSGDRINITLDSMGNPVLIRYRSSDDSTWITYGIDLIDSQLILEEGDLPDRPGIIEIVVAGNSYTPMNLEYVPRR